MVGIMTALRLLTMMLLVCWGIAARAEDARPAIRIISINMCTDQLLLDLAEPSQIAGLSPFVRDAARSWAADRVGDLPVLSGTAEEIILLKPDYVLSGRYTKRATREFIRAQAIPLEEFDAVQSVAEAKEQILRVAMLVGAQAKGRQRIAELDAALERLKSMSLVQGLRILPLSRRGWVAGRKSLVSDLLAGAGLVNAASDAGLRDGGFLSLEAVISLRPDALLITREDGSAEDQGSAMLLHPAIASMFPPKRRIVIPEMLTVCGGPMLREAMSRLTDQLSRLAPRQPISSR
jgi:iron complex transport system substrate-binding protein